MKRGEEQGGERRRQESRGEEREARRGDAVNKALSTWKSKWKA